MTDHHALYVHVPYGEYFCGVLIFIIFVVDLAVIKISNHEN